MGWFARSSRSRMASRRKARPQRSSCQVPWASGPRWAIAAAIRSSTAGSGGPPPTMPPMPHMAARLAPELVVELRELPADHVDVVLALRVGAAAQAGVVAVLRALDPIAQHLGEHAAV